MYCNEEWKHSLSALFWKHSLSAADKLWGKSQMLVSALTVAKQEGWVSDETAMRLLFQFAGEELDVYEEQTRIRTQGKGV